MRGKYEFDGQLLTTEEIRLKYIPMVKSNDWIRIAIKDGCKTQADLISRFETRALRRINKPAKSHPLRGTYK